MFLGSISKTREGGLRSGCICGWQQENLSRHSIECSPAEYKEQRINGFGYSPCIENVCEPCRSAVDVASTGVDCYRNNGLDVSAALESRPFGFDEYLSST